MRVKDVFITYLEIFFKVKLDLSLAFNSIYILPFDTKVLVLKDYKALGDKIETPLFKIQRS